MGVGSSERRLYIGPTLQASFTKLPATPLHFGPHFTNKYSLEAALLCRKGAEDRSVPYACGAMLSLFAREALVFELFNEPIA